ncbi:MAG: DUF368 domain-containing protein [Oscillospiraceae bacterium]|jgi:putative membrane protein|nr:DUF368 domain-containing protein [Oscillospiraceae bacterium]
MLQFLLNVLFGLIIGSLMLVPGVSGGTTALILGIYDRVVSAVSSFRRNVKGNLLFLGALALGGAVGVLLLASPLKKLIDLWYAPMYCLFVGLTTGSIPMLVRKTGAAARWNGRTALKLLFWLAAGAAVVAAVELLPEGLMTLSGGGFRRFALLLVLGVLFSAGFVLPGISLSYLMVVFGVYEPMLDALKGLDVLFLLPLALGLAGGTILVTKGLEWCMKERPLAIYTAIIGFVLGSDFFIVKNNVLPNLPWTAAWYDVPVCVLMFAAGFAAIWLYTRRGAKKEAGES